MACARIVLAADRAGLGGLVAAVIPAWATGRTGRELPAAGLGRPPVADPRERRRVFAGNDLHEAVARREMLGAQDAQQLGVRGRARRAAARTAPA